MPHFFIVLFKINLVLVLFAATYYLVLRRLTFYYINRIFLLFGILFSTAYPFINLTDFFGFGKNVPAFVPKINQNVSQFVQQDAVSIFWQTLTLLFYAGVLLMSARLMIQFISLRRMHKNSNPGYVDQFSVRILNDKVSPFSFWQTIYINPLLHKQQDLNNIIQHEKVHVEEWHTIDIILAEICLVFYWFNPGVWLMKKAVKENIEFITDAKILSKGIDKKAYQYSLLDVGTLMPSVAIVNNFNLSDLKKRIKMMNAKRSSRLNLSRYLLVVPVLLVTTLAFTIDKKDVQKSLAPLKIIVNRVLPHNEPILALSKKPEKKQFRRQLLTVKKSKKPDTIRTITLVMHQSNNENDTTNKILNLFLANAIAKTNIDDRLKKHNGKMLMTSYVIKDSTNAGERPTVKNFTIKMKYNIDRKDLPTDEPIRIYGKGKLKMDTLNVRKPVTYFLNGEQVSKDKILAVDAEQISNVMLNKAGFIEIRTKQK
jgi:hypothetical protein